MPDGKPPEPAKTAGAVQALGPAKVLDVSQMSFEDALAELEQIVRGLEGGQQKLEDAIVAYERRAASALRGQAGRG